MTSLQAKLYQVGKALADAIPGKVSHYFRDAKAFPFCVWAETGEAGALHADNGKAEQAISGVVDYFTQVEYDPNVDTIQETLQSVADAWSLDAVQFEDAQRVIHYTWAWSVILVDGGGPNG